VSSKLLSEKYRLRLSSASLRNEMVNLTEEGYLFQPHTSAGRIPTEKAYRFFVDKLCKPKLPSQIEKELKEIALEKKQEEEILRDIGKFIAAVSKNVSILFKAEEFFWQGLSYLLSQPEFYDIDKVLEAIENFEMLYESVRGEYWAKGEGIKVYFPSGIALEWQEDLIKSYPIEQKDFFLKDEDLSLILGDLEDGLIGILGPTRMDYEQNIALIKKVRELLTEVK